MEIRVNWNQGKAPGLIRAHQVLENQPDACQFDSLKGDEHSDFPDLSSAEEAMKERNFTKYKRCKHCWDNKLIDPIL